jgi:hypothetical protein
MSMRLFMFASQPRSGLHAFAGEESGDKLPAKYAPWNLTGILEAKAAPPHGFSRKEIERSIGSTGFQLWRERRNA